MPGLSTKSKPSPEILGVADQLRHLLSRWVHTTREQAGTPTSARLETLRLLQEHGPSPIAALAQRRSVKHQSMRLVVEQLVSEGAVTKEVDETDRRNQRVSITRKGLSDLEREQRVRTEWIAQLLESCNAAETDQIVRAMNTLESLLNRSSKAFPKPA